MRMGRNLLQKGWQAAALLVVTLAFSGCSEPWITGKAIGYSLSQASPVFGKNGVTVRKGDTVYGIARRHGVTIRALIDANGLRPPYTLRVGGKLKLPGRQTYIVRKGDTVYGISRKLGTDMRDLVRQNRIRPPYRIAVGQELQLSQKGARVAAASPAKTTKKRRSSASSRVTKPPPRQKGNFLMPVKGKLLAGFGPKSGGLHNDGINISAPRGTPVRAAENGVVVYVGNELRGFGNLLLIKHANGWVSAYGHTDGSLVKRGDVVKRGEQVAKVGKSGNVTQPQLHFELRRGVRAVNPLRYLTSSLVEKKERVLAKLLAQASG